MSIQNALEFLRVARRDEAIQRGLDVPNELGWADLVRIGAQAGLHFSTDELQRAHALDWRMRWARYAEPANDAAPG